MSGTWKLCCCLGARLCPAVYDPMFHEVLTASILTGFAVLSSSVSCFVRTLTKTCPSWVALHGVAHSFIELCKPLCHDKAVICEGAHGNPFTNVC